MSRNSGREEGSGRGRHRGEHKDAGAKAQEDKAKGHDHLTGQPGLIAQPEPGQVQQERGHQKGFGRNQQQEGESRHTQYGTRAPGAEHG